MAPLRFFAWIAGAAVAIVGIKSLIDADTNGTRKRKCFISFDYDNDLKIKEFLIGQTKNKKTPFDFNDHSIKHHIEHNWIKSARNRIKNCDVVIVMCGRKTHTAIGVAAELTIAIEEEKPYFLLRGYREKKCTKPTTAKATDIIHDWEWESLSSMIHNQSV